MVSTVTYVLPAAAAARHGLRTTGSVCEQPRVVRDHPGYAHRLERLDLLGVVDGPDVELAPHLPDGLHEPAGDEPPVRHHRVAAARLDVPARHPRQPPARPQ